MQNVRLNYIIIIIDNYLPDDVIVQDIEIHTREGTTVLYAMKMVVLKTAARMILINWSENLATSCLYKQLGTPSK